MPTTTETPHKENYVRRVYMNCHGEHTNNTTPIHLFEQHKQLDRTDQHTISNVKNVNTQANRKNETE